ncbi:hypothetical protein BSKO_12359 [Bryopsis sp. KO-2023]|nr:hypothetical protein BSKO_12359 [Bryopsis sp. KO-2023]
MLKSPSAFTLLHFPLQRPQCDGAVSFPTIFKPTPKDHIFLIISLCSLFDVRVTVSTADTPSPPIHDGIISSSLHLDVEWAQSNFSWWATQGMIAPNNVYRRIFLWDTQHCLNFNTLTSATSDQLHKAISGMLKGGTSHQVTSYNHRIEQLSCNPGIVAAHHEGTRACTRTRPDIGRTVSYLQHTHTHTTR